MHGILLPCLGWCSQLLLRIVGEAAKLDMQSVCPSLAASREHFAQRGNVASSGLFYRYYFGRCFFNDKFFSSFLLILTKFLFWEED